MRNEASQRAAKAVSTLTDAQARENAFSLACASAQCEGRPAYLATLTKPCRKPSAACGRAPATLYCPFQMHPEVKPSRALEPARRCGMPDPPPVARLLFIVLLASSLAAAQEADERQAKPNEPPLFRFTLSD